MPIIRILIFSEDNTVGTLLQYAFPEALFVRFSRGKTFLQEAIKNASVFPDTCALTQRDVGLMGKSTSDEEHYDPTS